MEVITPSRTNTVSPSGWFESAVGVLLLVAPSVFGYAAASGAVAVTHRIVGVLAIVAGALTARVSRSFSWLNLLGGALVLVTAFPITASSPAGTASGLVLGMLLSVSGLGNGPRRLRG